MHSALLVVGLLDTDAHQNLASLPRPRGRKERVIKRMEVDVTDLHAFIAVHPPGSKSGDVANCFPERGRWYVSYL